MLEWLEEVNADDIVAYIVYSIREISCMGHDRKIFVLKLCIWETGTNRKWNYADKIYNSHAD